MRVCILNFYLRWIKSNLKELGALTPICGQFSSLLFFFFFLNHHHQSLHLPFITINIIILVTVPWVSLYVRQALYELSLNFYKCCAVRSHYFHFKNQPTGLTFKGAY